MTDTGGVTIRRLTSVGGDDPRGPTYEWCRGVPGMQLTVYKRKAGSAFGTHYHRGDDPSKDPERFLLITGRVKLEAYMGSDKIANEIVEEGHEILIRPNILHNFEAITDIVFLEYRSTVFDRDNSDVHHPDTYLEYFRSIWK